MKGRFGVTDGSCGLRPFCRSRGGLVCGWLQDDLESELFEASNAAVCCALCVALVLVVFTKILVECARGQHVVSADEELVADGQGSATTAPADLQLGVLALEEAVAFP